MVQPFVLEVLISYFERYHLGNLPPREGICPKGAEWGSVLKLYINWIFLFQSKILILQWSVSIKSHKVHLQEILPYIAMLRNSKNSNSPRSFQSQTFKNNRVMTSNISVILKPERSFYDDLFKRYRLHRLTN